MTRRLILAVAAATALLALALPSRASAAEGDELIRTDPASVTLEVPAPGHEERWRMTVANRTSEPLPLFLRIEGLSGALLDGPAPLHVELVDEHGRTVFDSAERTPALLPRLEAGASYTVHGTVSLPVEADNRYQGLGSHLSVAFTTVSDAPADPAGGLADTGFDAAPVLMLAAGLALVGAAFLIRTSLIGTRRKGSTR